MSTGFGNFVDNFSKIPFYWDASQGRKSITLCGTNDMDARLKLNTEEDILDMYHGLEEAMRYIGMGDWCNGKS